MSEDTPVVSELDALKAKAKGMDIKFNPNIGIDKLKIKIQAAEDAVTELADLAKDINKAPVPEPEVVVGTDTVNPDAPKIARTDAEIKAALPEPTPREKFAIRKRRAAEQVRINVACMNPNKKDWEGELFSVGSPRLGTFKKYVHFNTEFGYHVPRIIFEMLKERKCQVFTTVKDDRGNKTRKGKLINEFSIEVLPSLTKEQLAELATQQALSGSID